MKKSLLTLCFLSFLTASAWGDEVTVPNNPSTTLKQTSYLPMALKAADDNYGGTFSVSQQLYFASELTTASSTTITAITFYCYDAYSLESSDYVRRKLRVWMNNTAITAFPNYATNPTPHFENPGTKVFSSKKGDTDNGVEVTDLAPYTLTFDTPFEWDGTSNILVTVFDSTGVRAGFTVKHDMIQTTGVPRFLHQRTLESNYADAGWSISNLTAATAVSSSDRGYVNKITFTFAAAAVPPATPSDLALSSVGANIATLTWSAVADATSYDLEQSTDNENWSPLASNVSGTSFEWTGLSAASTQYARISAKNDNGSSAPSSAVTVTTDAAHEHNGVSFNKWVSTTSMPNSGNYYLTNDVTYDFYEGGYLDLAGDLNLCLNGHTINLGIKSINVTNGHTMTLFDHVGGGKITGFVAGDAGALTFKGVISVENGGTLVLREGEVENTFPADDPDNKSIAVASGGNLIISGAPVISGNDIDIFLAPTNPAKVITIESGKPLTNSTPYKVYKMDGVITSGWANMSGAAPKDHFVSANSQRVVCLNGSGEAELVGALALNENSSDNESRIAAQRNQLVNVNLTRSVLTNASFNSICLPFPLTNAQLEDLFGEGYDLEEFVSSELVGEELVLTFNKVTALVARKPYLIQPSVSVTNPEFEGVTIASDEHPLDEESDEFISFHGVFNPTSLTGGNKNLLFLGAGNELFWPAATGDLKGFRAYFEVKGEARKVAKRARIGKHTDETTAIENQMVNGKCENVKMIKDGQLLILRDGKTYNVMGQIVK